MLSNNLLSNNLLSNNLLLNKSFVDAVITLLTGLISKNFGFKNSIVGGLIFGSLIFCVLISGCIVTDEMEFMDKVNYPPEITSTNPQNTEIFQVVNGAKFVVNLTVWDFDKEDEEILDGIIVLYKNPYSSNSTPTQGSCFQRETLQSDEESTFEELGVEIEIECRIDINKENSDVMLVQVQISDRGFNQYIPAEDSRLATVTWTLEVTPISATSHY